MENLTSDAIELKENPLREFMVEAVEAKPLTLANLIQRYQKIEESLIESGGLAVCRLRGCEVGGVWPGGGR